MAEMDVLQSRIIHQSECYDTSLFCEIKIADEKATSQFTFVLPQL
jgi:hypothetical protein